MIQFLGPSYFCYRNNRKYEIEFWQIMHINHIRYKLSYIFNLYKDKLKLFIQLWKVNILLRDIVHIDVVERITVKWITNQTSKRFKKYQAWEIGNLDKKIRRYLLFVYYLLFPNFYCFSIRVTYILISYFVLWHSLMWLK